MLAMADGEPPSPSKDDSAALVAARAFEEATLRRWVKEVAVERGR